MRKKNIMLIAVIALLTICSMVLTACGDDKDKPTAKTLVGQWELLNVEDTYSDWVGTSRVVYEFTKDGKIIVYSYFDPIKKWVEEEPQPYSFSPSEDGTSGTLTLGHLNSTYEFTDYGLCIHLIDSAKDYKFKRTKGIKGEVKASDM